MKPGPDTEWTHCDFKTGSLMTNGRGGHQHFNASNEPARFPVIRSGNYSFGVGSEDNEHGSDRGREGRGQIEYEDEDPRIHALFEQELDKRGLRSRMHEFIPSRTA